MKDLNLEKVAKLHLEQFNHYSIRPDDIKDGNLSSKRAIDYYQDKQKRLYEQAVELNRDVSPLSQQSLFKMRKSTVGIISPSQSHIGFQPSPQATSSIGFYKQEQESPAFGELKNQLRESHEKSIIQRKSLEKLKIQAEIDLKQRQRSQVQRKIREGFTHFNIINFSAKNELLPYKKESLGKVFDFKRATYHNYQKEYAEKVERNENIFRRSQGEFAKQVNNIKNHLFINNPLTKV